jgi:hypothetical protein
MSEESQVTQAYRRCQEMRRKLTELNAKPMECTEDECGIVWQRYVLPSGTGIILFATPSWYGVFEDLRFDVSFNRAMELSKLREAVGV